MNNQMSRSLSLALNLAKNFKTNEALNCVFTVDAKTLSVQDLRKLALIYSYCGDGEKSMGIWQLVAERLDFDVGDNYMLSMAQLDCGLTEDAIASLMREISISLEKKECFYIDASTINLAILLNKAGRFDEAVDALKSTSESAVVYVRGLGQITKRELLEKIQRRTQTGRLT